MHRDDDDDETTFSSYRTEQIDQLEKLEQQMSQLNKMGSSEGQTYCLRWNNHKSNLVEILHALIHQESYVDCTIYVDEQVQFKAHRVVLAANSPYFQSILQDRDSEHCCILFPGVQPFEMKALLEYMYTGEVNVTQSQIPRIMKIAEQLEVKGLFDMSDIKEKFDKIKMDDPSPFPSALNNLSHTQSNNNKMHNNLQSSPIITTSTNISSSAQSSSSSPPYNYKSHYSNMFSRSPVPSSSECQPPQWSMAAAAAVAQHLTSPIPAQTHFPNAAALSSVYESGSDMNPLKRKKLSSISSMLMSHNRDTPILRNVLAQPHSVDSSQHASMVCTSGNNDRSDRSDRSDRQSTHSNGTDYSDKKVKYEEPHSPYTEKFDDEDNGHNFSGSDSRIASYVPQQQKPEWKRYKQYTRNDITAAIECVRGGMSALQASRIYKVPSRTLYDKVKKLGITAGRPMNRTIKRSPSNNGSPAAFPYGISGTRSPYPHSLEAQSHSQSHSEGQNGSDLSRKVHLSSTMPHPASGLLDASFLQALESRGGGEALTAMAMVAVAQAQMANGMSTSPGTHGAARSPSPNVMVKYMRSHSPNGELNENNHQPQLGQMHAQLLAVPQTGMAQPPNSVRSMDEDDEEEEEDHVEDLSMTKKEQAPARSPSPRSPSPSPVQQQPPTQLGVIVPPMTKMVQNNKEENNIMVNIKHEITIDEN